MTEKNNNLLAYIQNDGSIDFRNKSTNIPVIPNKVYTAISDPMRGIYFELTNDLSYLNEYYLMDEFEELVLESFKHSNRSLAALYVGLKGSGKTKRAHKLALDSGMPILVINNLNIIRSQQWNNIIGSEALNNWVIIIDEYEKKIDDDNSVALLSWLDGEVNTKQLFILIGNSEASTKFSDPLVDRLSRVLWRKNFSSLGEQQVIDLVEKLSIREDKEDIIDYLINIPVLSMDNTMQIIKTTNLFKDKSIYSILPLLNISFSKNERFVLVNEKDESITCDETTSRLVVTKNSAKVSDKYLRSYLDDKAFLSSLSAKVEKSLINVWISVPAAEAKLQRITRNKYKVEVPWRACTTDEEFDCDTDEWPLQEGLLTIYLHRESALKELKNKNHYFF